MRAILAGLIGVALAVNAASANGTWKITKDHWDASDEQRFGEFVTRFGEHDCATPVACFKSTANPYRDTDPPDLNMDGDCADFVYQLRAYFAWKNGLPFSYALYVMPRQAPVEDSRFTPSGNTIAARLQIAWQDDADPVRLMNELRWTVSTAMLRVEHVFDRGFQASDFYSPKIEKGAIRAGTIVYDVYGHVVVVYKVTPDGTVHWVDSNPDRQVTRGAFGPQFPRSSPEQGAMFKNFRPIKLVDYTRQADGTLTGGRFVLSANDEIPDYSAEQYYGTQPNPANDWKDAKFILKGKALDFYGYVKAKLAN